ncbi:hypothetical protein BC830DRAFT_1093883 [Chytriomyces sp. MP71]|nr:hypothetical protein BC830DRAFT_1093883 [Chytriomyces sp. MP71]
MASVDALDRLCVWSSPTGTETAIQEAIATSGIATASDHQELLLHAEYLTQLARAQGLQRRFDDAKATLEAAKSVTERVESAAEAEAEAAGDGIDPDAPVLAAARRVRVRILLESGRVLNSANAPEQAVTPFRTALQLAKIGKEPDVLADLSVDALHMLAIVETEPDAKFAIGERAIEMATKSKNAKARKWIASLQNNQGWNLHDAGEFEAALERFNKALEARKKDNPAGHQSIRVAQWCVARCKRSLGETDEALAMQEQLNEGDVYVCEERAILYDLKGIQEKSKEYAAKALALFKEGEVAEVRLEVLRGFVNV